VQDRAHVSPASCSSTSPLYFCIFFGQGLFKYLCNFIRSRTIVFYSKRAVHCSST